MADKPERLVWHKSARCSTSACVEVAAGDAAVHVRDGAAGGEAALTFGREPWRAFVDSLKSDTSPR